MKISILSVAPPYRGGIAEQTYCMSQYLSDIHDVNVINFKRQYPEFLFPGKTQYESETISRLDNNYRLVDTLNPFSWSVTANFIIDRSPDLILLRFWNPFFAISYSSIIKKIKKTLPRTKIIAVCDNIVPHEQSIFDKQLIKLLFSKIDGFIVMSDQVKDELIDIKPKAQYKKLFHPVILEQKKYSQAKVREELKIYNDKIILFFGFVRPYKGLDTLIEANQNLSQKLENYKIIICGECYGDDNKYNDMITQFSKNNEIEWINEYLPEKTASKYFAAADIVVLPYKSASQSGVIPLSYSYEKPVIASNIKGIKEMVQDKKTGFLFEKSDSKDLGSKIIKFYQSDINYKNNIIDFRKKFSWKNFTKEILDFYRTLS